MCFSNQVDMPDFMATLDAMAPVIEAKPARTTFRVLLNFRKGPDMSTEVDAADEVQAIAKVRRYASECGFTGAEKRKPTVYAVQA